MEIDEAPKKKLNKNSAKEPKILKKRKLNKIKKGN